MEDTYYTIGMAGHIDHGKTTLTKALTNIDTDRLKEEKERNISIELGYAPLHTSDGTHVSVVDVPGHERFIRQMIAGVAGIDLVVLVIAADEGVMPQTKEHLEILEFLGIKHGIVAVTKIDRVDEEMLEIADLDIAEALKDTVFQDAKRVLVDSVSGKGIDNLRESILHELTLVKNRDRYGSFRMPIDQVFTVQGQGTIVRGTVYEGIVNKGSQLSLLPSTRQVRARNIQVHHQDVEQARAGQRSAINLGGINREEVNRGDVLVASDHFLVTNTIDVSVRFVDDLRFAIKQRAPVKVHVGTSEVMGKIVFFDRNSVEVAEDEVLCQIRLDKKIVVRRGDRFILRRPTPMETVGGGWIIDPKGEKYRFGKETITLLQKKKEGTPEDLIKDALTTEPAISLNEIIQMTSLDEDEAKNILLQHAFIELPNKRYALKKQFDIVSETLLTRMEHYHNSYPMRLGMNKAELIQLVDTTYPKSLIEYVISALIGQGQLKKVNQYIALEKFEPHLPVKWQKRMEEVIMKLKNDGLSVDKWETYVNNTPFSKADAEELKTFLLQTNQAYLLADDLLIHQTVFDEAVKQLQAQTNTSFDLKEAKDIWNVSRKYLIPLLELLDQLKLTRRDDKVRYWI